MLYIREAIFKNLNQREVFLREENKQILMAEYANGLEIIEIAIIIFLSLILQLTTTVVWMMKVLISKMSILSMEWKSEHSDATTGSRSKWSNN